MLAGVRQSRDVHQEMLTHKPSSNAQACGEQVANKASTQTGYQPRMLSGAMDVDAACRVAVSLMGGARPQPAQTFKLADFLVWIEKPGGTGSASGLRLTSLLYRPAGFRILAAVVPTLRPAQRLLP